MVHVLQIAPDSDPFEPELNGVIDKLDSGRVHLYIILMHNIFYYNYSYST